GAVTQLEPELTSESADGVLGRRGIELEPAGEGAVQRQITQQQVGVRDRRLRSAAPVAGGTWIGAGRLRPDSQRPARITPPDRPAPRSDRVNGEHRKGEWAVGDLAGALFLDGPFVYHANVAGGSAHVEAQRVWGVGRSGHERRAGCAPRWTRQHGPGRVRRGGRGLDQAAVGLHDRRLGEVAVPGAVYEPPQV